MILFLTEGFGDGHNTAARNVASALARLCPGEPMKVVDVVDEAHRLLSPAAKAGYQFMITRVPSVWGWMFKRTARMALPGRNDFFLRGLQRSLNELLVREKPRAIVSTFPVYSGLLQTSRESGFDVPPLFTVITDSITIHPLWTFGPSDRYYVADEDSRRALAALGVAEKSIAAAGFPVSLDFTKESEDDFSTTRPGRILYLPSTGDGHVQRTLEALRPALRGGAHLTLPLGKHYRRLYHIATRFTDSLPEGKVDLLGWTTEIPHMLQTHDFVICKAGGAILHEALAACCPAIIDYIVPGQEEGNAELLVMHDCGVVTRTPRETGIQAARFLEANRSEAIRLKRNMMRHSMPAASLTIARDILARLQPPA